MVGCIDFPIRLQSFGFYYETVVPIRNSVLVGAIDLTALTVQPVASPMLTILRLLFSSLRSSLRSRAALQAEILALCHQLMVLQRSTQGRRVRFLTIDRVFWVWLSLSLAERVCRKAGLAKDAPVARPVQPPSMGRVIEIPQVGGLHHRYERRAA